MAVATVSILRLDGRGLLFDQTDQPRQRRALTDEDAAHFKDWAGRYDRAAAARNDVELLKIGQEIFAWLDADGHGWGGKLLKGSGEVCLDIVTDEEPDQDARDFLNVPWELLAREGVFLAEDELRPFCPQRRLGGAQEPRPAKHKDLAAMFMAAAPRNVKPELNYEAEEAGILQATDNLPLLLTVEESGCATFLRDRLAEEGPFEIVQITGHGNIGPDGPYLALEDEEGNLAPTTAPALAAAFGEEKPGLLFLSACRTAEQEGQSKPLAISLMRAGVPAVLGWDGSVYDTDASHFAREVYAELARHERPALAAGRARRRLIRTWRTDPKQGEHWHMARLYVSPQGGGPLCVANGKTRPEPSRPRLSGLPRQGEQEGPRRRTGGLCRTAAEIAGHIPRLPRQDQGRRADPRFRRSWQVEPRRARRRPPAPA